MHVHLGSQISDLGKYKDAATFAFTVANELRRDHGFPIDIVDLGGGMGIEDGNGQRVTFDFVGLARTLRESLKATIGPAPDDWPVLYFEPNRALVGNAGILLGHIVSRKEDVDRIFVGTNTGFSAFVRPMLYGARHEILSVKDPFPAEPDICEVVGPLCESGDTLGTDIPLADPKPGDILVVCDAGAYGFAQTSRYNSLPRPGEVLIDNGVVHVIREPERYCDLNKLAHVPPHLVSKPSANGAGGRRALVMGGTLPPAVPSLT